MLYFRSATTEAGHANAGHGDFENMKRRAGMASDWSALKHQKISEQQDEIGERLSAPLKTAEARRGAEVH